MRPHEIAQKRILISALNWGLGHVTRTIALVKILQERDNTLFIACSSQQQQIFESELSNVTYLSHDDYPFKFGGNGKFTWDVLHQLPSLLARMYKERKEVDEMVVRYTIDLIISDQRMGFHSLRVPSILLTHQVNLPVNGTAKCVQPFYKKLLKKFSLIWIPDLPHPNSLTGKLSDSNQLNRRYIGPLSRFEPIENIEKEYDFGAIISGPAPYNHQLFNYLKETFRNFPVKSYIIFNEAESEQLGNLNIHSSLSSAEMGKLLQQTKTIVSRSGYSTIMDLKKIGAQAYFIPTPGQGEQIYLYKHLMENPELGILVSEVERSFIETYILPKVSV